VNELERFDWSVAIFAAREAPDTLIGVLNAVLAEVNGRRAAIDFLINGNEALAREMARQVVAKNTRGVTVRIWDISLRDKSYAWNEYVHRIWPPARSTLFLDGYVRVVEGSLVAMEGQLGESSQLLCVSAAPTQSRSADKWRAQLAATGGVVGGMHALPARTMERLRRDEIRLPLGIYRGDSLLAAIFSFDFDPTHGRWDPSRAGICWPAGFQIGVASAISVRDLRTHFSRAVRQGRGAFENKAYRHHLAIERRAPSTLPFDDKALVCGWVRQFPFAALRMAVTNPMRLLGLWEVYRQPDWTRLARDARTELVSAASPHVPPR